MCFLLLLLFFIILVFFCFDFHFFVCFGERFFEREKEHEVRWGSGERESVRSKYTVWKTLKILKNIYTYICTHNCFYTFNHFLGQGNEHKLKLRWILFISETAWVWSLNNYKTEPILAKLSTGSHTRGLLNTTILLKKNKTGIAIILTSNPSAGEVEAGRSLGFTGSL